MCWWLLVIDASSLSCSPCHCLAHLTSPHLTLALRPSLPLAACLWPACLSHAWLYQLPPMLVASHVPGASRLHASPNLPASSQLACWPGLVCVCVRLRVCRCFVAWPCLPAAVVACHAHACWLASLCCWWLVLGAWCLAWRCLVALSALLICLPLPLCLLLLSAPPLSWACLSIAPCGSLCH